MRCKFTAMQLIFKFAKTIVMPRGEGEGRGEKTFRGNMPMQLSAADLAQQL